jgi:hypothetical protein
MAETDTPIVVTDTVLPTVLATALRQIVIAVAMFAVGKGWIDARDVEGIATLAAALAAVFWGLNQSLKRKSQLITTAEAAPNSVAIVTDGTTGTRL